MLTKTKKKNNLIDIKISEAFIPLLKNDYRYLILVGGAGSGKSEFAARKELYRMMKEGDHCFLVMRKVRKTLQDSVIEVRKRILENNEIPYNYNKSDRVIKFYNSEGKENIWKFDGMDDPEKIKSIKGITGITIEEMTEFNAQDFRALNLRLREPTDHYKQIICMFNPDEEQGRWIKDLFFPGDKIRIGPGQKKDSYIHKSTVHDNPIKEVREQYIKVLEDIQDEVYRQIYLHGQWAVPKGKIYDWDIQPLPDEFNPDDAFYGGDFGYPTSKTALTRIYRKGLEFWVKELIYDSGLLNSDIARLMKEMNIQSSPSYWDSAEEKSIEELYRRGINALPAIKGPGSVKHGINILQNIIIHIIPGSQNLIDEARKYKWQVDKNGEPTGEPVKFHNHLMDAVRYGIYSHCKDLVEYEDRGDIKKQLNIQAESGKSIEIDEFREDLEAFT